VLKLLSLLIEGGKGIEAVSVEVDKWKKTNFGDKFSRLLFRTGIIYYTHTYNTHILLILLIIT